MSWANGSPSSYRFVLMAPLTNQDRTTYGNIPKTATELLVPMMT